MASTPLISSVVSNCQDMSAALYESAVLCASLLSTLWRTFSVEFHCYTDAHISSVSRFFLCVCSRLEQRRLAEGNLVRGVWGRSPTPPKAAQRKAANVDASSDAEESRKKKKNEDDAPVDDQHGASGNGDAANANAENSASRRKRQRSVSSSSSESETDSSSGSDSSSVTQSSDGLPLAPLVPNSLFNLS